MEFAEGTHLANRISPILLELLMLLFFGISMHAYAIDSTGVSSLSVIRMQLQSIADEVVGRAELDHQSRVAVIMEGEGPRSLAENAFIEALQKRGYRAVLGTETSLEQTLQIFILDTDIKVQKLDENLYERNIGTTLEVRTMAGKEREVRMLGTFQRAANDTANVFPSDQVPVVPQNDEDGIMEKLLTPLIVIGSAVVIIYLLFTVRS